MPDNYKFFMEANLDEHTGKWIAVCNEKIVAQGDSAKQVLLDAKKACPKQRPFIARVPDERTMIF